MENSSTISETWMMFKEHLDKKHIENAAEKFVELCADFGADDITLKECFGNCEILDTAIRYYLDLDSEIEEDYDWD
jgi:hypothetical protein